MTASTPTALTSAEDALREAFEQFHAAHFFEHFAAQPLYRRKLAELAFNAGFNAALQSPRASDEAIAIMDSVAKSVEEAGWEAVEKIAADRGDHATADEARAKAARLKAANPVPVDASGADGDIRWARDMAELSRQQANTATRPLPELQAITRQQHAWEAERWERVAEALSHTAPVADAQAKEGE